MPLASQSSISVMSEVITLFQSYDLRQLVHDSFSAFLCVLWCSDAVKQIVGGLV